MSNKRDYIKQIASMGIFGTVGLVRKRLSQGSGLIALFRGIVGALFLTMVSVLSGRKPDIDGIKRNWLRLLVSGVLLGANWACLFEAYVYTSISVATMCYYMAPVIVILASVLIYKERMSKLQYLFAFIALVGMVFVSGVFQGSGGNFKGVMFGLLAACMYASVVLLNRSIRDMAPMDRTLVQLVVSAIIMLPYVLFIEKLPELFPIGDQLLLLVLAGILHTGVAYLLYFGSIPNLQSHTVAILSYIDPVTAVIVSVLIQKEGMSLSSIVGIVLVIGATLGMELAPHVSFRKRYS